MDKNEDRRSTREGTRNDESIQKFRDNIALMQKKVVIRGENHREFERFAESTLQELSPKNKIQMLLAEKFIFAAWKLQRARALERLALTEQNGVDYRLVEAEKALGDQRIHRIRKLNGVDLNDEKVRQLIQYQSTLEKTMEKALKQLRSEQRLTLSTISNIQ